jgi:hypothetical protein
MLKQAVASAAIALTNPAKIVRDKESIVMADPAAYTAAGILP